MSLLEMRAEGKSAAHMARELNRSENGVEYRLRILKAPKPQLAEQTQSRCPKCAEFCVKDDELVFRLGCGYETEESRRVVIIG